MKPHFTYQYLLKSSLYLLLFGQIWANTASYCYMVFCEKTELIEHSNSEHNEHNESEEDSEKEKNKLRININTLDNRTILFISSTAHLHAFATLHHPEITTPPPEFSIL